MTITLNDTPNTSVSSSGAGPFEFKSTEKSLAEGPSFGQLMTDLWQSPTATVSEKTNPQAHALESVGQAFADVTAMVPSPLPGPETTALTAISLGPHLSVITAQSPAPDAQSLESFARSQGLDDKAVNWLFGTPAKTNTTASIPAENSPNASTPAAPIASAGLSGSEIQVSMLGPRFTVGSLAAPTDTAALSNLPQAADTPALPNLPQAADIGDPVLTSASPSSFSTDQDLTLALALTGGLATGRMAEVTSRATGLNTAMGASGLSEDGIPLNLFRMPPPAAVWVQRTGLSPQAPNPTPSKPGPEVSVTELDLGADWAAELFAATPVAEGSAPNGASTTGTQGTAYANFAARWDALAATSNDPSQATVAASPENTSRAETIQNLADKMGHAIGQRILSEMEKGQWHLKLQLRPATLGHIEVEMRLRSGEFDAVFTAPHQLTRDLLQDGMSRLKETLSQMGMDVASIHVQDGQSGQRGGESTPGGTLAGKAKEEPESKETQTDPSLAQQVKKPSDGLDILV